MTQTEALETPVLAEAPETPVFLGARRRVRWLRAAGVAVGALVVLWLIALVAGVLGFGSVTGLSLPGLDGGKKPVLHRTAVPVTAGLGGSRIAPRIRPTTSTSTSISLRARGTPSRAPGRSRVLAGRRARGRGGSNAPHRSARTAPSTSAAPSAGTVHGRHLGNGGSGTSSPSTSNSHRAAAPGQ